MGGYIKLVFRDENDSVRKAVVWTNPTPHEIHSMRMLNKDRALIDEMFAYPIEKEHAVNSSMAPDEYGIIVIDWKLNKISACSHYTGIGRVGSTWMSYPEMFGPDHVEEMTLLANNNRILSLARLTDSARKRKNLVLEKDSDWEDGPSLVGKSFSEINKIADENFKQDIKQKKPKGHRSFFFVRFDMRPFEVLNFRDGPSGFKAIKKMLEQDGFQVDGDWSEHIKERVLK